MLWCQNGAMAKKKTGGHYIREWRKHRHLTQEKLAEMMGITRNYLSMIEKGKRRYDQNQLESAAIALRCEPADLISRDPAESPGLWALLKDIEFEDRDRVARVIEAVISKKTGTDG